MKALSIIVLFISITFSSWSQDAILKREEKNSIKYDTKGYKFKFPSGNGEGERDRRSVFKKLSAEGRKRGRGKGY